jgi:hypothetical protein
MPKLLLYSPTKSLECYQLILLTIRNYKTTKKLVTAYYLILHLTDASAQVVQKLMSPPFYNKSKCSFRTRKRLQRDYLPRMAILPSGLSATFDRITGDLPGLQIGPVLNGLTCRYRS